MGAASRHSLPPPLPTDMNKKTTRKGKDGCFGLPSPLRNEAAEKWDELFVTFGHNDR
jgi:hypothetical protein